jgi:hypothetical protein
MEKTRVRGFVIEVGSVIDPTYWVYRDENRACVMAAADALELALEGETAIVDGVRGVVYFGPDGGTIRDYEYLRTIGPPADDPLLRDAVRHLAGAVMGVKIKEKAQPPYEFKDQDRLIAVAKKARAGLPIEPEDDAWMREIILVGMPTPEAMLAAAKKPKDLDAPPSRRDEKDEKEKDEAGAPKGRAARAREEAAKRDEAAKAEPEAKKDEPKPEAAKPEAKKPGSPDGEAGRGGGEEPKPAEPKAEEKKESAADKAAARKAQREAELAAQRASRGGKKEEPKAEEKKAEEAKAAEAKAAEAAPAAAPEEYFDPLGDQV